MHSAARRADEGTFEVDAENFGTNFSGVVAGGDSRASRGAGANPTGDGSGGAQSAFFARGNGGGAQRGSAARSGGGSDNFQGFARCFHDVAAARAVNVQIDETRHDGEAGCFAAARIYRYGD